MSDRRFGCVLFATAVLLSTLAGCVRDEPTVPAGRLRIATGSATGVYYPYGEAIAKVVRKRLPQLQPEVLRSDGSLENLKWVADGTAEIGFAQADTVADFRASVVTLARLYDDYLHLVVPANSPVQDLAGLKGLRVSIAGSGTLRTVDRLLTVAGLDRGRDIQAHLLNPELSAAALLEGKIDAFFYSVGLPAKVFRDLKEKMEIRLVKLGEHAAALSRQHGPFYLGHTVPVSTYHLADAVSTIGVPNLLVVSPSLAKDTAYALTRALFEERTMLAGEHETADRLNLREAINTYPLELHPGAVTYYQESKP